MTIKEPRSSTPGGTDAPGAPSTPAPDFIARVLWRDHELVFHHEKRDLIARYHEQGYLYEQPLIGATLAEVARRGVEGGFIDVGAHVGNHTVAFMKSGRFTWGVALEPDPRTYARLEKNVRLNGLSRDHVRAVRARAGDRTYIARAVYEDPSPDNTGMRHSHDDEAGEILQQFALEDVLDALITAGWKIEPAVSLVKIDVEGSELDVLEGARRLIERCSPTVLVESESVGRAHDALPADYHHVLSGGKTPTHLFARRP
jgi:protein O-GlcNAc transferase